VLLPSETHRKPVASIKVVLVSFVTYLPTPSYVVLTTSSALKMEAVCSSEMLVLSCHTSWYHNTEDYNMKAALHFCSTVFKSLISFFFFRYCSLSFRKEKALLSKALELTTKDFLVYV
jgi:hypothetical protein